MPSNNKQESDYSRQTINKKGLRTGDTTGSCAAAASKAALSGGITSLVSMPDSEPIVDQISVIEFITRRARETGGV